MGKPHRPACVKAALFDFDGTLADTERFGIELDEKFVDVIVRRYISEYGDAGVFILRGDEKIPYGDIAPETDE